MKFNILFYLFFGLAMVGNFQSKAAMKDSNLVASQFDSIRNSFIESLGYCELVNPDDTLKFIKDALSAFVSYDNTVSYHDFFFCFEPGYMNLPDTDPSKYPIAQLYLKRDIRWLFLFYLERYILHDDSVKVDKFCRISFIKVKGTKEIDMYGPEASENLILIYRKLIRLVHKKSFAKQFKLNKHRSLLSNIGYRFEIRKTVAYEFPSY